MPKSVPRNVREIRQGGTSAVGRGISLGAILIAVAFTAVISVLAHSEWPEDRGQPIPPARPVGQPAQADPDVQSAEELVEDEQPVAAAGNEVLDALEVALQTARFNVWVDGEEGLVILRSHRCADPALKAVVDGMIERVASAFEGVRCVGRGGSVGFERLFEEP